MIYLTSIECQNRHAIIDVPFEERTPLPKEIEDQKKNETLEEWIGKYQEPLICPICCYGVQWSAVIKETKWELLMEARTDPAIRSKIFNLIRLRLQQNDKYF